MSTLFLLPESRLAKSPSAQDKLSPEDEYDIRVLGCELIQSSGLLLNLPQTAMATAQVLFHRFYYSKSLVRYPMQNTAMACVALASKIEESPKRIRDVVKAFHKLSFIRKNLKPPEFQINEKYASLKNEVVRAERRILKELGFYVYVNHPHKFIVTLLQILDSHENQNFVQTAWSYMNDGLRTDVFLRYSAETIACSCVYLSARILDIPLPEDPAWWEVFLVTEEDIRSVCKIILKLYTRPKPDQERLEEVIAKLAKESESSRKKLNIMSQLSKSANDSPVQPLVNNHAKKVKVEHIIQVPDSGKRQLNSTIEVKEIKDLTIKDEDQRRWKSQERNHSRSPTALKRSRSRSRSRENSRRKYASKESRDSYSGYRDYPASKDYYSSRDYAGSRDYASSKDYAAKGYREYSSKDYYDTKYETRYERNGRYEEKNDRYDDRRYDESRYEESRYNGKYSSEKYSSDKYTTDKYTTDKYSDKNDRYSEEYYQKSGRERSSKSRRDGGR